MMSLVGSVVGGLLVAAGLAILITWLVIQPHKPKYYLDNASVSQFKTTSDGLLNTNLDFKIRTRNPNKRVAIYYYRLQAYLLYGKKQIGWATLPMFYHGHKNTTILQTNVSGQEVVLDSNSARDLKLEQQAGTLDLDLKLYSRVRFKVGSWKSKHYHIKVHCHHVIVGMNAGAFKPMQCKVHV
jgi:hypothetical protein